jgi:hypothetical protein
MGLRIITLPALIATARSVAQLAKWLKRITPVWIGYYNQYYRWALYGMWRQVNKALIRGARCKFKPLRGLNTQAGKLLEGMPKQKLRLPNGNGMHWAIHAPLCQRTFQRRSHHKLPRALDTKIGGIAVRYVLVTTQKILPVYGTSALS